MLGSYNINTARKTLRSESSHTQFMRTRVSTAKLDGVSVWID